MGRDHGAAMVELAFVLTFLVMLLVGIVSSAIALGQNNSIHNAAREASRFGATLHDGGTEGWFEDVRDVARAAALGDLDPGVPGREICVAFITAEDVATHVIEDGGPILPGDCFTDDRDTEARVQIVVQRESTIQAVVFSTDVTLSASAAARYER